MLSEYKRNQTLDIVHLLPCKEADGCAAGNNVLMQMLAQLDSNMMAAEIMLRHVKEWFD